MAAFSAAGFSAAGFFSPPGGGGEGDLVSSGIAGWVQASGAANYEENVNF